MVDWSKLKVVDLRNELRNRGLQHSGLKQELVQRLADQDTELSSNEATEAAAQSNPKIETQPAIDEFVARNDIPAVASGEDAQIGGVDTQPTTPGPVRVSPQPTSPTNASHTMDASPGPAQDDLKRKRRSTTPQPDPKRIKAGILSSYQTASSNASGPAREVSTTNPVASNASTAGDAGASSQALPEKSSSHCSGGSPDISDTTEPKVVSLGQTDNLTKSLQHNTHPEGQHVAEPALHPTTRALYIRDFMRPLRAEDVRAHLCIVSTQARQTVNEDAIEIFYLDPIRTHAFVVFNETAKAIRARTALHNVIWPEECNRKPLWVDFVPPEKVRGWIVEESADGPRRGSSKRWGVRYGRDHDENVTVTLEANSESGHPDIRDCPPSRLGNQRSLPAPSLDNANAIPLGPRQGRPAADAGLSLGLGSFSSARGPGLRANPPVPLHGGLPKVTQTEPSISYQTVSGDIAVRRVSAMRSCYTRDISRDLGREDEINRYTFEAEDVFVDRGREFFIGIRPPHRETGRHHQQVAPRAPPFLSSARPARGQLRDARPPNHRYHPGANIGGPLRPRIETSANDTPIGDSLQSRRRY